VDTLGFGGKASAKGVHMSAKTGLRYPEEFKAEAVQLARSSPDRSIRQLAYELGIADQPCAIGLSKQRSTAVSEKGSRRRRRRSRAPTAETRSGSKGMSERVPEEVCIWLLGSFRESVGSLVFEEIEWRLRKAASLVKLLALAPRPPHAPRPAAVTLRPGGEAALLPDVAA
jgi:transposase-like protein